MLSTLGWVTQWPLWACKKQIYDNQVWIFIDEIPPLHLKKDGLRRALEEMHRLEHTCFAEGLIGWVASVDFSNWQLTRALEILQAKQYAQDQEGVYYLKHIYNPPLPKTVREGIALWRQRNVASA